MLTFIYRLLSMKTICLSLLILLLSWTVSGCGDRIENSPLSRSQPIVSPISTNKLAEVAAPSVIARLQREMDRYEPQVSILSPQKDEILDKNTVKVQIQVQDLPIFKNADLELGPHLTLILDNQPSQAVYDLSEPVILEGLTPGTHTIRVFASRPWFESFKNEGAYAQTTFHVLTKNGNNTLNPSLPLLTYNRPRGTYGAEPILLDFYLTNAPLHVAAKENPELADWRIKATINGESFLLDDWQSIYLKGFQKGENWVQLEFIDDKGKIVENTYNNTVRIITYDPEYNDSLTQLIKGELPIEVAKAMIDPNYTPQPPAVSEPEPTPVEETPEPTEELNEETPTLTEEPTIEPSNETPTLTEEPTVELEPEAIPEVTPIEPEPPQITTEAPPLEQPEEPLKPEETPPELIEPPTVPPEVQSNPPIILEEPKTEPEKEPSPPKSRWIDKLLKPFPFQEEKPPIVPEVEEPTTLSPQIQPEPIVPNIEPSLQSPEPFALPDELPEDNLSTPKLDNERKKVAIPKFI